jgi:hypothetical protein
MAAHVIKRAQLAIGAAHDQQRFAHQLRGEIIARLCHLVAMPHHLPASRKNAFLLGRKRRRLGIEMRGQSPRPRDLGINVKGLKRVRHIESRIIVSWGKVSWDNLSWDNLSWTSISDGILKSNARP